MVVSGPAGVGKNTLVNAVVERFPGMRYSTSVTTRSPRPGEVHGRQYFFVSPEEFRKKVDEGELLEWAEYCGNLYGTPRSFVEQCVKSGQTVILDIEVDGARQLRQRMPEGVFVFLLPPSIAELEHRMQLRASQSAGEIERRLKQAALELQAVSDYDYCIVNDDLSGAVSLLEAIILAERCRTRRLGLGPGAWRTAERGDVRIDESAPH